MQSWGSRLVLGGFVLLCVFLLGAVTRSGFIPSPGSATTWRLPATDTPGCFSSDGLGHVSIVACTLGSGTGDASTNTGASLVDEVVLFANTSGKLLKRGAGTGIGKFTSGVITYVAAPSGAIVGATDTQVLTNKDSVRRSITYTDAATVLLNADTTDVAVLTTLSQNTLFANPTTTSSVPNGKSIMIRIKSSSIRTLTYGTEFRGTAAFPCMTATSGSNLTDYMAIIRNSMDLKWDCSPMPVGF
jgi:hypothetical protein